MLSKHRAVPRVTIFSSSPLAILSLSGADRLIVVKSGGPGVMSIKSAIWFSDRRKYNEKV